MATAVLSLRPKDQTEGGGRLENATARIKESRFVMYAFPKQDGTPSQQKNPDTGEMENTKPSLNVRLMLEVQGVDGEHAEYYPAGYGFVPNPDDGGKTVVATEGQATNRGMTKKSKLAKLINECCNAGVPESVFDDSPSDVSVLDGYSFVWQMAPDLDAAGKQKVDKKGFKKTFPVPAKLVSVPGAAAKGGTTKAASAAKGKKASAPAVDVDTATGKYLVELLSKEEGKRIERSKVGRLLYKGVPKDDGERNTYISRVSEVEFLEKETGWAYDAEAEEIAIV